MSSLPFVVFMMERELHTEEVNRIQEKREIQNSQQRLAGLQISSNQLAAAIRASSIAEHNLFNHLEYTRQLDIESWLISHIDLLQAKVQRTRQRIVWLQQMLDRLRCNKTVFNSA